MKAIAVDDEIYMLETLQEAVSASSDIEMVEAFSSCSAALTYATENPVDIAFLDINMRHRRSGPCRKTDGTSSPL